ncbi:Pimeloyl-ACP methyl ester carboxylesterase [Luteibacter sp. UNCMF331Sha3.1]|uniref:alpha/beta fold hydrolase n=1 Tax=Luteibacter sp. UNCMF331Sha3.1 TaxID=1502760 RepID=UPI0008CA57CA|nr:alpha/beta hydrolase [Luteibacter sp. UNCMF331Sha3.1]SEN11088.1 Pimeloyl-ACP methyl ester carboxylesterase [Luteibacter sp. UNCMF331Sha3.1]
MKHSHYSRVLPCLAIACVMATGVSAGDLASSGSGDALRGHPDRPQHPDLSRVNVVLVHGAFADGSSWSKVIPLLRERGLHVVAVQNPESSLADDADAATRTINQQSGPVVLVGHSWAGAVITQAGINRKVKALVYVSAFAPDKGQSVNDILAPYPAPAWASALVYDEGNYMTLPEKNILEDFAPDLPKNDARLLATIQVPWNERCLGDKLTAAAWRTKPSTWVLSLDDRIIPAELQEQMSSHIGAKVTRIHSSHVSLLSHPREVAEAIIDTAEDVAGH